MKTIRINESIPKCPTGIQGLDEITCGGLPRGRTALVCGAAGCGKTMPAMHREADRPGGNADKDKRPEPRPVRFAAQG